MRSSHATRAAVSSASVISQVLVPSSTTWGACSIRPCTDRKRVSVLRPGSSPVSTWEERVVSQLSRSGPVTVTTPLWERSTTVPGVRTRERCSRSGSP